MNQFFNGFIRKYLFKIFFFSFFRVVALVQVLFGPYALARIVNILTSNPRNYESALFWLLLLLSNALLENVVRLRSKFGLEKLAVRLVVDFARHFSEKTELKDHIQTGQAVQAIKVATEKVEALVLFYKENGLQLPVNFIAIPIILFKLNRIYLLVLVLYMAVYIFLDLICLKLYRVKFLKQLKALEKFWGTEYRKAPDVWRKREDENGFARDFDEAGQYLYSRSKRAMNMNNWRWVAVQSISSASKGLALFFVIKRIARGLSPVGDIVLVLSYFDQIHGTLNQFSSAVTRITEAKTALNRLNMEIRVKE